MEYFSASLIRSVVRSVIEKVAKVTAADLRRVSDLYFRALFDPSHAKAAVVCHPTKVNEIRDGFTE